jgi:chaperonin GroES
MNENYATADSSSEDAASTPGTETAAGLNKRLEQANIAEKMDEEKLNRIGADAYTGYRLDLDSKSAWDRQVDEWVKLAAQVKDVKTFPWAKASNIKYPILATAAMQFAARAYPQLIPADGKIVQFKVVGVDPQGQKAMLADKLATHMNYQLMEEMDDWEEEMDRLLIQLPVVGCLFKKTYFDPIRKKNVSKLIGPKDLVVNYWASSLEEAHRKTEICPMTKNQIKSQVNAGLYLDVDLGLPQSQPDLPGKADVHGNTVPSQRDDTTPFVILEQHTFLDLDDDGYQEPYVVTFEEGSRKVLRIVARYDSDGIITAPDGKLVSIEPVEYYTKYGFIPNPDGGFYDIGFGHLLGPINESANTVINQLVDAGTLANLQAGFIGKGLRLKLGESTFQPGEWKAVNATGDDIKKQIFPLPTKEPSETLFKLLGMLVESAKELASIAEIFTGKMPGQNTPATTTQSSIEQGMKVFTAIYKRTYRSLKREFKKVFRLNSLYDENFEKAQLILDVPITKEDYNPTSYDVCPTADPQAASSTQKQMKAQGLLQMIPLGTLNIQEVTKRVLEAQEQPNIEALVGQPTPPKDPKMQAMQAQMQMKQEEHQMSMMEKQMELKFKEQEAQMDAKYKEQLAQMEFRLKEMEFQQKAQHQQRQAVIDSMTGAQSMQQSQAQHQQKLTQMRETADAKRQQGAMAGMEKPSSNPGTKRVNPSKN